MQDLLFLCHRIPYPPNKGDKIRCWNIFRHLSERFHVHLACFVDDRADHCHEMTVRDRCGESLFLPLVPARATIRSTRKLLTGAGAWLAEAGTWASANSGLRASSSRTSAWNWSNSTSTGPAFRRRIPRPSATPMCLLAYRSSRTRC